MARKPKADSDIEKALAVFAKHAEKKGKDSSKIREIEPEYTDEHIATTQELEVDAVLMSLHYPHRMLVKKCRLCGNSFVTNYCAVGYCSHSCRTKELASLGIEWVHDGKPVWGKHEPPLIISFEVVKKLRTWATWILEQEPQWTRQCLEELGTRHADEILGDLFDEPLLPEPHTPHIVQEEASGGSQSSPLQLLDIQDILGDLL